MHYYQKINKINQNCICSKLYFALKMIYENRIFVRLNQYMQGFFLFFFLQFLPRLLEGVLIFQKEVLIKKGVYTDGFESFNLGKSGKCKYSICHSRLAQLCFLMSFIHFQLPWLPAYHVHDKHSKQKYCRRIACLRIHILLKAFISGSLTLFT